ncbi:hypothetical protein M9H77_08630 [Catharanthus roseus]|uniref:Uncharacterized protein n=1 Tax=Catharanthus roseus TaxID=4058 RepID=A0ACC0BYF2_CATRO|nr:hypothetical protein M9H77_08630 [Catharanthus roseus]
MSNLYIARSEEHPSKSSHSPDENSLDKFFYDVALPKTRIGDLTMLYPNYQNPLDVMESFQSSNRTVPDSTMSSIGEPEPISRNAPKCVIPSAAKPLAALPLLRIEICTKAKAPQSVVHPQGCRAQLPIQKSKYVATSAICPDSIKIL